MYTWVPQTSRMESFLTIDSGYNFLTIVAKLLISGVGGSPRYVSGFGKSVLLQNLISS